MAERPSLAELLSGPAGRDSLRALRQDLVELRARTLSLGRATRRAMTSRVDRAVRAAERAQGISWTVLGAGILSSLVISWLIVRGISRSLSRLKEGTAAVAEGRFEHRIEPPSDDELGRLARAFNAMTEKLGELDELKRNFLAQVSHDLNTPLASIQETTKLLLDGLPGDLNAKQERLLRLNLKSGKWLSSMITRLLDLSRMEAGAMEYDFGSHDLAEAAREVDAQFRSRLHEERLELETEVPEDPVPATVDRERVLQVLDNLLENAVRHSPDGGRIRLELRDRVDPPAVAPDRWDSAPRTDGRRWVLLSVADTGPGVPPDQRELVFRRFHQAERTHNRASDGVGLGLALCRNVVEAHGGRIWVEESRAGGSEFRVLLPADGLAGDAGA